MHIVPPYDDQIFPHQSFPPWQSLMRVFRLIADVLASREQAAALRAVEVRLFQASRQIIELARGDLSLAQWHRRACVAIDRLEQAKRAVAEYVIADQLTVDHAQLLVAAVDDSIARLGEASARVPLPDLLAGDA
jgi:hypothetical protein